MGQLYDAGNTTTIAHYLAVLSDAGLLTGIQKYSDKAYAAESSPRDGRARHLPDDPVPGATPLATAGRPRPAWAPGRKRGRRLPAQTLQRRRIRSQLVEGPGQPRGRFCGRLRDQPHRHRGQKRASASPGRVPLSHKSGANGAIRRHVMDCQHVIRSRRAADVYLLKFGANSSRRMNSFGFVSCNALLCTQPLHITAASRGAAVSVRCSKSSAREKFNSRVSFVYRLFGILRQGGVDSRNAVGT